MFQQGEVIRAALLGVAENSVGLGDYSEPGSRRCIGVDIGVKGLGEFAISLTDVIWAGGWGDAQGLVVRRLLRRAREGMVRPWGHSSGRLLSVLEWYRRYDDRMSVSSTPVGRKVVLCPGQGAQTVGMGKGWFERSPEARAVFAKADAILGSRLGAPLSTLCFDGPAERLNQTDVSQPAIFVTSVACWHGLLAAWGAGSGGDVAGGGVIESHLAATAGLSLGEYTALHLAGAFGFEAGLELVTLRGRAMQDAADAIKLPDGGPGSGMVALIGADDAQAGAVCDEARQGEVLVPANFNCPGQIVISGSIGACRRSVDVAAKMGLRATQLTVAGAFHSPLMQPAADRLAGALAKTPIQAPRCPVMSNVTGVQHAAAPGRSIEDSIRARLVDQLTHAVRWETNCRTLIGSHPGGLHELAPGKTLMGMMRRTDKSAKVETHDEP